MITASNIESAREEFRDHLLGVFGSAQAAADFCNEQGFSIREAAGETGWMSQANIEWTKAVDAAYAPLTVNGVIYPTVAEASAVRKILADAGIPNDHPSSPKARRVLADAGQWSRYLDAIEGKVVNMGSLDPLDIGVDLRETKQALQVPDATAGELVRVILPRSNKHPRGEVLYGSASTIRTELRQRGFNAV